MWIGIGMLVLSFVFPPWKVLSDELTSSSTVGLDKDDQGFRVPSSDSYTIREVSSGYRFIGAPPPRSAGVDVSRITMQCAGVLALMFVSILTMETRKKINSRTFDMSVPETTGCKS